MLACGWVLCTAGAEPGGRLSGAEVVQAAPPVCGQGGFRIASHGSVESSYLAELAGALDVMRSMMECAGGERGCAPGVVTHWCDNLSVVRLIQDMELMPRRYWRTRPCRNLWAELKARLSWWRSRGGVWVTRWVKGHVDRDDRRNPDSYTVAEQLNIKADAVAAWASGTTPTRKATRCQQAAAIPGGVWRGSAADDSDFTVSW